MPIHVRAEPGDYAEAVLLPGDPLRAKYIAETYLDDVVQTNSERGMLGFRGTWEGKPVSVQATGMGCPSAAIVIEELVMLGCKRLLRVGTCGGLQPHHALGDMIVALSRGAAGRHRRHVRRHEPHCPTADWGLVHGAVHAAKELGQPMHVGPVVSSDVFYNPDGGQYQRWSDRGILAVEMEAAMLFTLGALRKVHAGCLLTVSDIVVEGEFKRISDDELRAAVDRMTRVGLATVTSDPITHRLPRQPGVGQRRHRQALARARAPRRAARARRARRSSRSGPGHLIELAERAARDGADARRRGRRRRHAERGRERARARGDGRPSSRRSRSARAWTSCARTGSRRSFEDAVRTAVDGRAAHDRRRPRVVPRVERRGRRSATSRTSAASA